MAALEVGMGRLVVCLACLLLLRLCESWIFPITTDPSPAHGVMIPLPKVSHPRCDACRAVALAVDSALRSADQRVLASGQELTEDELELIIDDICSETSFSDVLLVSWEGEERLSCPRLDTWLQGTPLHHQQGEAHNWPNTVATHCRYLVERMKRLELYDLWLRAGHRHPASWIEFLCEGEGVFGDCIQDTFRANHWPGAYKKKKSAPPLRDHVVHLGAGIKE